MAANSSSVSVINHMPLSSLRSVSVPLSDRKLPTFRAFSSTAMADAGMDDVLMFEDDYLVAATGLQSLWSLALATVDVYAILVKRSLQNRRLVSLFAIGDGVTSTMTFAAAFATAGITVLIDNDLNSCSANHCVQFETSTAIAFISWLVLIGTFKLPTVTLEGDIFQPSDLLTGGSRKLEMLLSAGEESAMFVTFEAAMTNQTNVHAGMLQRLLTAWDKVSNPTGDALLHFLQNIVGKSYTFNLKLS